MNPVIMFLFLSDLNSKSFDRKGHSVTYKNSLKIRLSEFDQSKNMVPGGVASFQ